MDRRIRKTQEAILEAFVELLTEKDFEQITINEIADRADVNRGTVYLHYSDKFDLLDQCIETHLARLLASSFDSDSPDFPSKTSLLGAFEYLEQSPFFRHALQANQGVPAFRNHLMTVLVRRLSEQLATCYDTADIRNEILVQCLASAIAGALEWWLMRSMPYPAVDMAEHLWSLLGRIQVVPQAAESN